MGMSRLASIVNVTGSGIKRKANPGWICEFLDEVPRGGNAHPHCAGVQVSKKVTTPLRSDCAPNITGCLPLLSRSLICPDGLNPRPGTPDKLFSSEVIFVKAARRITAAVELSLLQGLRKMTLSDLACHLKTLHRMGRDLTWTQW